MLGLESIGKQPEEEMPRQMSRGLPTERGLPVRSQTLKVEIAQSRNLDINWHALERISRNPHLWHGAQDLD